MKAILISIQPKWVAKILNGEKTLEIRKTFPKCELPIDVYIYCTKKMSNRMVYEKGECIGIDDNNNEIILENNMIVKYPTPFEFDYGGKVVAKFTLNKIEPIAQYDGNEERYFTKSLWETELFEKSCLDLEDMRNYIHNHYGYAWHIDNLVIFDKPKEISEFKYRKKFSEIDYMLPIPRKETCERLVALTRAPESYCYVEV